MLCAHVLYIHYTYICLYVHCTYSRILPAYIRLQQRSKRKKWTNRNVRISRRDEKRKYVKRVHTECVLHASQHQINALYILSFFFLFNFIYYPFAAATQSTNTLWASFAVATGDWRVCNVIKCTQVKWNFNLQAQKVHSFSDKRMCSIISLQHSNLFFFSFLKKNGKRCLLLASWF